MNKVRRKASSYRKPGDRKYFVGNMVWVEDSLDVWSPAVITEVVTDKTVRLYYFDTGKMSAMASVQKIHSLITTECGEEDVKSDKVKRNLVKLHTLSTPVILHAVAKAYLSGVYYLGLGPGTVLALNPFKEVDGLFGRRISSQYHKASLSELAELPPHTFLVAERAMRHMRSVEPSSDQSIIISGESGAGKTWTTCSLMRYFTQGCNPVVDGVCDQIEERILSSNPVLEAFGNAATRRNHNSSRFGKYIKLQYNRSGAIVGATLDVYMLEKTRAAHYDPKECSFHIFYQLLLGASTEEKKLYRLPDKSSFISTKDRDRYNQNYALGGSNHAEGDNRHRNKISSSISTCLNDRVDFDTTKKSMLSVGIDLDHQQQIFSILSALLHLKEIEFELEPEEDWSAGTQPPCQLAGKCKRNAEAVVHLLQISTKHLQETLTVRKIQAGASNVKGVKQKRRSVFKHPCTLDECSIRRDVLVKLLYERLFLWIVRRIAAGLSVPGKDSKMAANFVGLLDVYGFESFEQNSLEQLCINYANERLQQYYVVNFLKLQKDELAQQGIEWEGLSIDETANCLQDLDSPQRSVFSFLNEECRLNRADGVTHFHNRITDQMHGRSYLTMPRLQKKSRSFVVKHFAGDVNYNVNELVFKNRDDVPAGINELLKSSKNPLVLQLMPSSGSSGSNSKARSFETVVSHFKRSLDKLVLTMKTTNCHYIRCIKPNTKSLPLLFEPRYVVEQLRASGIVETAQVCSLVHPHQVQIQRFVRQFSFLLPEEALVYDFVGKTQQEKAKMILEHFVSAKLQQRTPQEKPDWQIGRENMFLRSDLYEELLQYRARITNALAIVIQRSWRKYIRRKHCRAEVRRKLEERERAVVTIQHAVRRMIVRKRNRAARIIQLAWIRHQIARRCSVRLQKRRQRSAAVIQAGWRRYNADKSESFVDLELDVRDMEARRNDADDVISIATTMSSFELEMPYTFSLNRHGVLLSLPYVRFKRPFRFSLFQSSCVHPIFDRLRFMEESDELKVRYSKRTRRWYLTYRPNDAITDDVNILPFVDSVPRNDYYRLS